MTKVGNSDSLSVLKSLLPQGVSQKRLVDVTSKDFKEVCANMTKDLKCDVFDKMGVQCQSRGVIASSAKSERSVKRMFNLLFSSKGVLRKEAKETIKSILKKEKLSQNITVGDYLKYIIKLAMKK